MSSLTKAQFISELKVRSPVIASFPDGDVEVFVDIALRYFSRKRPVKKVSPDNAVIDGQDLYDFPTGAIRVTALRTSEGLEQIGFGTEDEGSGKQIRPGVVKSRSSRDLMAADFYTDPLSSQLPVSVSSYDTFDIIYDGIQDMDTIEDDCLDAIAYYTEYLACNSKAETQAGAVESSVQEEVTQITDSDSTGASTSISFVTSADSQESYTERAITALEKYEDLTKTGPYGVRA